LGAIAHQRRGEFHLREGNDDDALYDINNAIRLYEDWGVKAKVEQLKENHTLYYQSQICMNNCRLTDSDPLPRLYCPSI
jgi:hypothetical protein